MTTKKNPKRVVPPPSNELKDIAQKSTSTNVTKEKTSTNVAQENTITSWNKHFMLVGVVIGVVGIAYFLQRPPKVESKPLPEPISKQELSKPSRKF